MNPVKRHISLTSQIGRSARQSNGVAKATRRLKPTHAGFIAKSYADLRLGGVAPSTPAQSNQESASRHAGHTDVVQSGSPNNSERLFPGILRCTDNQPSAGRRAEYRREYGDDRPSHIGRTPASTPHPCMWIIDDDSLSPLLLFVGFWLR